MKVGKFVGKVCATAIGGTIAYVAGSFIRDLFDVDETAIELEDALEEEDDDDFFIDEDELFGDEEKPEPEKKPEEKKSEEKEKTE